MKRNPETRDFAKTLRSGQTPPEKALWQILRGGRLDGVKFARQVVIAPFIADFAARSARLIVELDGDSHAGREAQDSARTAFLEAKGYRVIRFSNQEVGINPEGVARTILAAVRGKA